MMESTARSAYRVATRRAMARWRPSRRRARWKSSRWPWTATICLVAAASGPALRTNGPLASAFALRRGSNSMSIDRRGLSSTRGSDDSVASTSFTTHSSLSELLEEFNYDALILDQFGVLHNGKNALDGTIDCVEQIANGNRGRKKLRLIVLSNTSSPSETALDRLQTKLGFDRSHFCGAVTSGEEAGRHIRQTYGTSGRKKGKFVWCTWDATNENVPDPTAFLDLLGPNVEPTVDVASAEFVVAHGSGAIRGFASDGAMHKIVSMGSFLDDGNIGEGTSISNLLEECARRNLPLVCANPDMVVRYHDGSLKHMPGKIADRYREILEDRRAEDDDADDPPSIIIFGKPHTEHFEACLRKLEEERSKEERSKEDPNGEERKPLRVAHVGDSLHHDVAGANAAGVPSIFIVGGIHAEELLSDEDEGAMPSDEKLRELFDREGITPTHVLSLFQY